MRGLPIYVVLLGALLAWRLRKRELPGASRAVVIFSLVLGASALPHTLWGWQVQQHAPLALLRVELPLVAAWILVAPVVAVALWLFDALASAPHDPRKRRLLAQAPWVLGLGAPAGIAEAARAPDARVVRIVSPALPAAFDGLRILQLSDLHLGPALGLDWLDSALARAPAVDLVAITGDFSNDLSLIAPALARVAAVHAPLGHFAIPGNHEHYIDIDAFNTAVRASPIRLLTGEFVTLTRHGAALQLLGIDYPHVRKVKNDVQFAQMLDALAPRVPAGFRVLLAHHPDALDQSSTRGIDVQLSGHTHGGQIEFFGRTPLGGWWLKYPRGLYTLGATQLFVTTGLGHWLPFRIDCPTELPIIELARA